MVGSAAFIATTRPQFNWGATMPVRLPIPPIVDGREGRPIDLQIRDGTWSFKPSLESPTLGFNQDYLGPTIRTRQHTELNLHYRNVITESVAVHGHGLHVPSEVDGGPQLAIEPGADWRPSLNIVQPAATCWYHSHTHGKTGEQTYHGLAGLIIIDDELTDSLPLPHRYGVDDLPIIIQDKSFDNQGRLVYSLYDADDDGWLGDTVTINGAINPFATVPAGKIRLRLLNGANARFYVVRFSDNRMFYKIASDGGLLEEPVPLTNMTISPGERSEIVIDMSDGKSVGLQTLFADQFNEDRSIVDRLFAVFGESERYPTPPSLTLVVNKTLPANTTPIPDQLAPIVRPQPVEIVRSRDFVLNMDGRRGRENREHRELRNDHVKMDMTINGAAMDMNVINERVRRGVWERWRIRSNDDAHPFHVHGCSFLIERENGLPVSLDQRGWKDIVFVDDDGWSEILVRFNHTATERHPYMYHCHILEHEDRGMMGQFTVS